MKSPAVLYEKKDYIGLLTLNRPDNRNHMDTELLPLFELTLEKVTNDRDLRCLVITGSGKSFCAGADFNSSLNGMDNLLPHEIFMKMYEPFLAVGKLPMPTIAAMNGHAIGGGFGLALQCDMRIAKNNAKYGANFARLGLHPGMAISHILPRLAGVSKACELLFTGRLFTGREALAMGIVNYSEDNVLEKAMELAVEIAAGTPKAVRMMKDTIYRSLSWDVEGAAQYEALCQSRTFEMDDAREGIAALLEKRPPVFKGK